MKAVIVIPARWASTRFPGKPLAPIAGVSLIQRVYERAVQARLASAVYIATDDARIAAHVASFGGRVLQPEGEFQSGTDRIAAAVRSLDVSFDAVINVQGDEPLIDTLVIDQLIAALAESEMATLACPLLTDDELTARDVVKVVADLTGHALYFSRAPLASRDTALRHIGIYGYRAETLQRFTALPPSPLERAESLEQLRALQNGIRIRVLQTPKPHLGVDRPEDVGRVEEELKRMAGDTDSSH
jgi:3-deoxy-manno-octulosonate cytidylyltransferase (CMP-KDO synthetase)